MQNPEEKRVKFKGFVVKKSSTLIDFMRDENISSDETDQVFYELLADVEGHNLVHYVEVATIEGAKVIMTPLLLFTQWCMHTIMWYICIH